MVEEVVLPRRVCTPEFFFKSGCFAFFLSFYPPSFEMLPLLKAMLTYGQVMVNMTIDERMLPTVQCFSCMSKDLHKVFPLLSRIYLPQAVFDDRCNEPFSSKGIPLVNCSNICLTLIEPDSRLGVILGYNYIRGCVDKIFLSGFLNKTALEVHKFVFEDRCRNLPWHLLMNYGTFKTGEVKVCSCYGNKCNVSSGPSGSSLGGTLSVSISLLLCYCHLIMMR